MAFMQPFYTNEPFVGMCDDARCEDFHIPAEYAADAARDGAEEFERITGKWWFRLSAPGYMDCTDWSGPYDSIEEAKAECTSMYDADPETGDDLVD